MIRTVECLLKHLVDALALRQLGCAVGGDPHSHALIRSCNACILVFFSAIWSWSLCRSALSFLSSPLSVPSSSYISVAFLNHFMLSAVFAKT